MFKTSMGRWMVSTAIILSPIGIHAQDRDRAADRDQPPPPPPPHERMTRIEAGTVIAVRTTEAIEVRRRDNRVFYGTVNEDVVGGNGRVAIPRGSQVEMLVRAAPDNDLILDLEAVMVNGERYSIDSDPNRIESGDSRDGVGANRRTGEYVGGGAVIGSIIGAIAGGGKGAAIGAAAGAAAGASTQTVTRGREVRVPSEAIVTFRLERPLLVGIADRGLMRDGHHYHDYYDDHHQ